MTDNSAALQAQYSYAPFGSSTTIYSAGVAASFRFGGYYFHERSGEHLTLFRTYNDSIGRWLSRDRLRKTENFNLYTYSLNLPNEFTDKLGLDINPICERGYAGCMQNCLNNLNTDLESEGLTAMSFFGAELGMPLNKSDIGLFVAGGQAGTQVSEITTAGGVMSRSLPKGPLPFKIPTPTFTNPSAYVATARGLATRLAGPIGMGLAMGPSFWMYSKFADCSDKCACWYYKCINNSFWL